MRTMYLLITNFKLKLWIRPKLGEDRLIATCSCSIMRLLMSLSRIPGYKMEI